MAGSGAAARLIHVLPWFGSASGWRRIAWIRSLPGNISPEVFVGGAAGATGGRRALCGSGHRGCSGGIVGLFERLMDLLLDTGSKSLKIRSLRSVFSTW